MLIICSISAMGSLASLSWYCCYSELLLQAGMQFHVESVDWINHVVRLRVRPGMGVPSLTFAVDG